MNKSEHVIVGLEHFLEKMELTENYAELFFICNKLANFWRARGYDV